jgi:hypothetical protein
MLFGDDHQGLAAHQQSPAPAAAGRHVTRVIRLIYVAVGLVLGGVWLASGGQSLISHIWRDLAVLVVLLAILRSRLRQRGNRPGAPAMPQLSVGWVIGAKLALLIVAAGVQWLLQRAGVSHAGLIVAAGLFVVVALAGPPAHHLFLRPPERA